MNDVSRSAFIVVLLVILVPLLSGALMIGMMAPGMMDGSAGSDGWSPVRDLEIRPAARGR